MRHNFQLPLDPKGTKNRRMICMDCGQIGTGVLTTNDCEPDGVIRTPEEQRDLAISVISGPAQPSEGQ